MIRKSATLTPNQEKFLSRVVQGYWDLREFGGLVDVEGSVGINLKTDRRIPVRFGNVTNLLDLTDSRLESLEGLPLRVGGTVYMGTGSTVINLVGAPREVGDDFYCGNMMSLESLEGAPEKVGGDFNCSSSLIKSFKGAPKEVGGDFYCMYTPIPREELLNPSEDFKVGKRMIWISNLYKQSNHYKGPWPIEDASLILSRSAGVTRKSAELTERQIKFLDRVVGNRLDWSLREFGDLVDIEGDLIIDDPRIQHLPVRFGNVTGDYDLKRSHLLDLNGSPIHVGGNVYIGWNTCGGTGNLTGGPRTVGGNFDCSGNLALSSLEGAPEIVKGKFICYGSAIDSLIGAPKEIGGDFFCENCYIRKEEILNPPVDIKIGGDFLWSKQTNEGRFGYRGIWPVDPEGIRRISGDATTDPKEMTRKSAELTPERYNFLDLVCGERGNYTVREFGGLVDVFRGVTLARAQKKMNKIPVRFGSVGGSFFAHNLGLTSMEGFPNYVGEDLWCTNNKLTSMKGAPREVKGTCEFSQNSFSNLIGSPTKVGGNFEVDSNENSFSMEGCPQDIGGSLYVRWSRGKVTLHGCPPIVKGDFDCRSSSVRTLEGMPTTIEGDFNCLHNSDTLDEEEFYQNMKGVTVGGEIRSDFYSGPAPVQRPSHYQEGSNSGKTHFSKPFEINGLVSPSHRMDRTAGGEALEELEPQLTKQEVIDQIASETIAQFPGDEYPNKFVVTPRGQVLACETHGDILDAIADAEGELPFSSNELLFFRWGQLADFDDGGDWAIYGARKITVAQRRITVDFLEWLSSFSKHPMTIAIGLKSDIDARTPAEALEYVQNTSRLSSKHEGAVLTEKMIEFLDAVVRGNYNVRSFGGIVDVEGDVELFRVEGYKKIKRLPVQFGNITGDFNIAGGNLITLEGCPKTVGGCFLCENNKLTSLVGGPRTVGSTFRCSQNNLRNMVGSPEKVGGQFSVRYNTGLLSLEGCTQDTGRASGGSFNCSYSPLESLHGCPEEIVGNFRCVGCGLHTLDGAPKKVKLVFFANDNPLSDISSLPKGCSGYTVDLTPGASEEQRELLIRIKETRSDT